MAEQSGHVAFPSVSALNLARVQLEARPLLGATLPALATALVALVAALDYVRAPGVVFFVFDDSYISLQFARNLAAHGKLSFDGHTWSTGATSILHVSMLASLIKLGINPIHASIYLGVVCHVLLALAVYWLAWAVFRSLVAATAASFIIAMTNYALFDAGNGMETSLFMAVLASSLAAILVARTPRGLLAAGGLIGIAILTRPEGVFLLPAACLYLALRRQEGSGWRPLVFDCLRVVLPGLAVLALLSLFSLAVTGKLTPGTGTAKLQFFQDDSLSLKRKLQVTGDFMGLFLGPMFPTLLIAFFAARRREMLLLALFWVPMIVFYAWFFPGGLSHYFYRYQHPVLPLIAVMAGGGVAMLVHEAAKRDVLVKAAIRGVLGGPEPAPSDARLRRLNGDGIFRDLLTKVLVAAMLLVLVAPLWEEFQNWRVLYRDASYETLADLDSMARDLNTIVKPDQTLATHDIGAVGYYADFKVLDLVGLVNPDVIKFHNGRHVTDYIDATRPDYLLIFPSWDVDLLHIFPGDHPDRYELVKTYPGRNIRPDPYLLYKITYPVAR